MPKSISFCTASRNRLWQIEETLPQNLESISDKHEIVLVDYGSTDGLSGWIWSNFKIYLENKKLVFFEVKNEVRWNLARAKNLAHRLASGEYLFNLDADNFVTPSDIELIENAQGMNLHCWQFSGSFPDGSHGRIGVPQKVFNEVGGYDETLLPMGTQDVDFLRRLASLQKTEKLSPPARSAIKNSMRDKVKELIQPETSEEEALETYNRIRLMNSPISQFKLETEGPIRVGGGFSYRGLLNGKLVTINGFNEIQKQPE